MNPLEQLQPLIDPPPVHWWPPAPGWWLLAVLLPLLGWGLWHLLQRWRNRPRQVVREQALDPLRQAALDELAQLRKPYDGQDAGPWLQQLNALLKRLCRERYPDAGSHILSSRAWLAFLDNRCPAAGLTRWMILVEGAYKPQCTLSDKAITELDLAVATWIRKHV
ncbi:DUF4381 domain-containing protein [Pseudomonas berkeleyensis]|uniref:DUF4381 domain-containing protein n=1 Tax=Pseudomonas berkeleyensis TaxID=2726956 RepID=A0A7G5DIN0_9PSED|nr:DUF4381 domain-containing protein [Pseudomonas berkeleyensis]QMV61605.1 DUF4381 domain-containing protein [Pseudomonas berkeleyensis]WSO37035.1 DUF4381 domain-containing protein [Pseudomonas berkeleyensis]